MSRKLLILTLIAPLLSGCIRHSPYAYLVVLDDDAEILDVGPRYSEADMQGEIPLEYQLERAGILLQVQVHAEDKNPTGTLRVVGADGHPLPFHVERLVACSHCIEGMDALGQYIEDPETLAMGCVSSHSTVITLQISADETEPLIQTEFILGIRYDGTYSWVDSLIGV